MKPSLWPGLLAIAIILLAVGLRLWQLHGLPPGLYMDAAVNGSDVRMLNSGARLPIYFPANTGREPLFIYLQALSVAIFGPTPYALNIVSAITGILTVPAVFFLASSWWGYDESLHSRPRLGRREVWWIALVAAAGLAVSYWHVSLSRRGLRTIMLPLISGLAFGFFWRAWTQRRYRDYALAGVFFGTALYTYTAARLLPAVLLIFVVIEGVVDLWRARITRDSNNGELWFTWRRRLAGLTLLSGVTTLLLLPLAITAWQEPGLLSTRIDQVSLVDAAPDAAPLSVAPKLASSVIATLRGFYDRGDVNARTNLPGRPANDPLQAVLFTCGILWAILQFRQARYRLLLIWLCVMLLPTILSTDAPNFVRISGALPPLVLLYAAAGAAMLAMRPRSLRRYGPPILVIALLVVSGGLTARDYFIRWPAAPRFGDYFVQVPGTAPETGAETLARLLPGSSPEHPILLSYSQFIQPHTVMALGPITQDVQSPALAPGAPATSVQFVLEESFAPRQPMFLVWQQDAAVRSVALEPLAPSEAQAVRALFGQSPSVSKVAAPGYPQDGPAVYTGWLPPNVHLRERAIANPLDVTFENGLLLAGYNVDSAEALPGTSAGVDRPAQFYLTLFWELDKPDISGELAATKVFVHLVNSRGILQQANGDLEQSYLFGWVKPGHGLLLQDVRAIPVPASTPAGKAYFEIGLFKPDKGGRSDGADRIGIVDGQRRVVANQVDLGAVMIGAEPPQADLAGLNPVGAQFDDRIELMGWQAAPDPADSGVMQVTFAWRVLRRSTTDYTAFVHLVDSHQQIIAQHDQPPGGVENPTTRWVPGESVRTTIDLKLRPGQNLAGLQLRVGLYEPASGKQLPLTVAPNWLAGAGTYVLLPIER